jgi:hypothetical protein
LTELSLHIWHDIAFTKLKRRIVSAILQIYQNARESRYEFFEQGEYVARTVETFFAIGACRGDPLEIYRHELEVHFLQDTAEYYSVLAESLLSRVSISEYLIQVELLCKEEQERCENKMHRSTVTQARQACCRVLVDEHAERICEAAELFLIHNHTQDLHRLFRLFSELPKEQALISFRNILKKYIEKSGLDVVKKFEHEDAAKNPEGYIEALVQVREKYYELIKDAFGFHALMRTALDQACSTFANSHPKLPELLANYTHYLMTTRDLKKKRSRMIRSTSSTSSSSSTITSSSLRSTIGSNEGVGGEEMETEEDFTVARVAEMHVWAEEDQVFEKKVENIGVVFCLLDDKDIFKKYYAKFLARRLIKGTSIGNEMEIVLIQKLRDICGCDFVSKLHKMIKDKVLSEEISHQFTQWIEQHACTLGLTNNNITSSHSNHSSSPCSHSNSPSIHSSSSSSSYYQSKNPPKLSNSLGIVSFERQVAFHHSIRFHCDVLTAGAWPIPTPTSATTTTSSQSIRPLLLPFEMEQHLELFTKFYGERSNGRKLHWVHHYSHGCIQMTSASGTDKRYELLLSLYQMLIVLLFNQANEYTEVILQQLTNIPSQELHHHLASLVKVSVVSNFVIFGSIFAIFCLI